MLEFNTEKNDTTFLIYLIASIGALGGILFGFDTGVISGALQFVNQSFHLSTVTKELLVSCVVLGALFGALMSGRLADAFGRRRMLIVAALAFILGTLITVFSTHVNELIAGRFILGLAIGVTSYTTPLFISEMAPASVRGSLVLMNAIMITGGEAIAYLVDYALTPTHSWRLMFAAGLIPAILLFIGMLALPSTPRFLVLKGLFPKAKKVLGKIRYNKNIEFEFQQIKKSCEQKKGAWNELFSAKLKPVLIIGVGLGILQQFVGINTVMYYGPVIFKAAGFHGTKAAILATFGMGIVNTVMSMVGFLIVDKVGRRRLLLIGSSIAAISLIVVGFCFKVSTSTALSSWSALVAMVFYIAGYCLSVGSMFWLIISEIYPIHVRGLAMSFVTAIQWGANFVVAMSFLSILNFFGASFTFWLYALMSGICFLFCYYLVPETTGVSLEKIQYNLSIGKASRELGQAIQTSSSKKHWISETLLNKGL